MKEYIKNAKPEELEDILKAVLARYGQVYPDWEVTVISLEKAKDRTEQLDRLIAFLEKMKVHESKADFSSMDL